MPVLAGRAVSRASRAPRLLVLGGGAFVGRTVVRLARDRGWQVTTYSWDRDPHQPFEVEHVVGDRRNPAGLVVLAGRCWDVVVDTWRGDAAAVRASARLLAGYVGVYAYVSSLTVYRAGASFPLSEADPFASPSAGPADESYAARKAAGEWEVLTAFGDRALIARAGLVLGPHEYPGRLPWWLNHVRDHPRVLAPGAPGRPVQFVDVRDLSAFLLDQSLTGVGGLYNVTAPRGHTTMGELLRLCRVVTGATCELYWVDDQRLLAAGLQPWIDLPLWIPAGHDDGVYNVDVTRALATSARFRRANQTVQDTWRWLSSLTASEAVRAVDRRPWLTRIREEAVLRQVNGVSDDAVVG